MLSLAGNSPARSAIVATVRSERKCNVVLTQWNMHIAGSSMITSNTFLFMTRNIFCSWRSNGLRANRTEQILTERNESEIKAKNVELFRKTEGKTRRDKMRN
jgi:hypothetical protein